MKSKFKRVCLVSSGQVTYTKVPAALAFMAGVCERNQIEYDVIDLNIEFLRQEGKDHWDRLYSKNYHTNYHFDDTDPVLEEFFSRIIEKIKLSGADCLAISVLSYMQHQWAEQFLKQLKSHNLDITTIAGGPGIAVGKNSSPGNRFGKTLADQDILDYYVLGEGDIVFDQFLVGEFRQVGLNCKGLEETWQPQIDNLDVIPVPSYKKINLSNYEFHRHVPQVTITGSRGCVRRCTFCDIGHHWKKFKFRTGKSIADEMLKHHLEVGVTEFFFNDSLMNGSLKQFNDFLVTINNYKEQYSSLENLRYEGQFIIRPRGQHSERMYQLMAASGCKFIQTGIESGSESVRDHMGKKFSNADIDYHFEMCEKYGITNWILIMCAYPTETQKDFEDTLAMFTKYQKYLINDTIVGSSLISPTTLLPNSPLNDMIEELQIHFLDQHGDKLGNFDRSSIMFESGVNPDLTVAKKYQRWIDLIRTLLSLGYRLGGTLASDVKLNHNEFLNFKTPTSNKKVWTIEQSKESYYS